MEKCMRFIALFLSIVFLSGATMPTIAKANFSTTEELTPQYLYRVLSLEDWKKSPSQSFIVLSKADEEFIHFSREDQLDRITEKYWSNVPEYVVLKIETNQLPGRIVYEANPGGTNKYYHLYDGSMPLKAVVEAKIIKSKK